MVKINKSSCIDKKKCNSKKSIKLSKKDLEDRLKFFNFVLSVKPNLRCSLLKYLSVEYLDFICEAFYNTVYVNNNLTEKQRKKIISELSSCKKEISVICDRKVSIHKKRQIFEQKGGFIPQVLSALLPIVSGLLFKPRN